MKIWLSEIWHAWRASLRRPGFLLLATGVLALGVGASVAVFTLIDQVLLQPLPLPQASRLVALGPLEKGQVSSVSPQQYQHLQSLKGVQSVGLMESFTPTANIAGGGAPQQVPVTYADRGLLPTLGVHVQLGRNFNPQEDAEHGPRVVILSHGFWQRRYAGDAHVIGRSMQVEGVAHTIIGVLPASFAVLGNGGAIMLPTALAANSRNDGTNYTAVARLSDETAATAVGAEVDARLHAMYVASGNTYWQHAHFGAQDFNAWLHADSRPVLVLFMATALFVLLIALVNLINLMLLRALARTHDAAVRNALGAPLIRLALPALGEGLLVGIAGAVAGMLLAMLGLGLLQGFMPAEWLSAGDLHFGVSVWCLALLIGLLSAVFAAALGLWRSRTTGTVDELREGGRNGMGRHSGRLGRLLVVTQMGLATALLGAAGLFLHTLYDAARTPLGFSSDGVLTFELAPVQAEYPDSASVQMLTQHLLDRLRTLPGVTAATATTNLPAGGFKDQFNLGGIHVPGGEEFGPQYHGVSPGFFKLFGIHLQQGRGFSRSDIRGGESVAIVDRTLAQKRYGGHALGKLIQRGDGADAWSARIVGVVDGTQQYGPLGTPDEMLYLPLAQMPDDTLSIFRSFEPMRFALKVRGAPGDYRDAVLAAMTTVAPDQPIANMRSMHDVVRGTTAPVRLNLLLVGIFATLSLLLATAGMYAVMAVAVAAREREFGVRSALGASSAHLTRLVLRHGLLQILLGLVLGVALAFALSGMLRAVMEQIGRSHAVDPLAIGGVCVLLSIAGLLACLLPALRAARVQPMHALRGE
ncbi:MAG TPA: ADOP family duplicated permease [Rhodanobacter sp.]|nr:ADOP family duplicated permease [Rhodanobacter sp.]